MHISCEKCGTTYVLDERLIPPQGAPVQCTKCQHVFTAMPPAPAPAAGGQTVIFGSGQAPAPAPPAPARGPAGGQTQIFGAGQHGPLPSERPSSQTQMFGAVPAAPAPAKPPGADRTVIFGSGQAPAERPGSSTQMFGAVSAQQPPTPAARPSNQTQMFGAVPAAPPAQQGPQGIDLTKQKGAPPRSTMIFGAGKPGLSEATVRVGAADLERMLKEHREARGGEITPPEGAPAQPEPTRGGETTPPESEPAPPARHQATQMFAMSDAQAPAAENTPREGSPPVRHDRTQMFAMSDASAQGPTPGEPPKARHDRTQMFAMSEGEAPLEATPANEQQTPKARHDRTQLFPYSESNPVPPVTEPVDPVEPAALPAEPRSGGRLAPPAALSPEPRSGGRLAQAGPEPKPGGRVAPKGTMIFGLTDHSGADESTDPAGKSVPGLKPVVSELATNPRGPLVLEAPLRKDPSLNVTSPHLPDIRDAVPLEEDQPATLGDGDALPSPAPSAPDEAARAIQASGRRRTVFALVVVLLVVLGLVAAAAWKLYGERLLAPKVAPQLVQALETELLRLRGDDTGSKEQAIKALGQLTAANPNYVEAHAALVTAYVLELDDVQQQSKRLERALAERNNRITRYNQEKSPADWENRANALNAEAQQISKDLEALVSHAKEIDGQLRAEYQRFASAAALSGQASVEAQRAALRAQALYQAYGGSDKALQMLKDYRALGPAEGDGWIEMVEAEYVVNARARPETITDSLSQLEALHAKDSSYLRTYTLAARVYLLQGKLDEAEAQVDKLLALKPKHDVAIELKTSIAKARAEKAAKEHEREEKAKETP